MSEWRELVEDLAGGLRAGLWDTRPGRLRPYVRLLLAIAAGVAAGFLVADLVGISGGLFGAMTLLSGGGIEAEHVGRCAVGLDPIEPGDRITKTDDGWAHVGCIGIELADLDRADRWDGTTDEAMGY